MSAYGDINCEWCGMIHHEQSDHACDPQYLKDEITRLRAALAEAERDAERYRWIESHVSEQLTEQSLQHEYSEHKTQYVLPKLIAWANFCGQITFAEAIDAAMAREEG